MTACDCGGGQVSVVLRSGSLAAVLLQFFVGGLLLAFTPCVLPMVPILSGLIVGQGKRVTTARAFLLSLTYVLGMAVTYTITGAVFAVALADCAPFAPPQPTALLQPAVERLCCRCFARHQHGNHLSYRGLHHLP